MELHILQLRVPASRARTPRVRHLTAALEDPSPEARDLVDTVRLHGEQSGAAQAAGVAWVLERQLPMLMGSLAGIEMGLQASGVPHQSGGVQSALNYLSG